MNPRIRVLALFVILPTVAVGTDRRNAVAQWCDCLSHPPAEYRGARDGTPVVSVHVPPQFVRADPYNHESQTVEWSSGRNLSLGINSQTSDLISGPSFNTLGTNECIAQINQSRVLVGFSSDVDSKNMQAQFETMKHGENIILFTVTAESDKQLCELGREFLWSAVLVNKWQSLKVRLVAADRKSFAYTNEVGEIRAAKIGQIISGNHGRVTAINETSVVLVELLPNGLGGYVEVERVIPFLALNAEG